MQANEIGKKNHYNEIDALKGIAIFLVVLQHSIILHPINLHENAICEFVYNWCWSVHMPLFFMISGFLFSYKDNYKEYIWKKAKRLMVPYIVFNAIDIIPRYLFSGLVNRSRGIGESLYKIVFEGGEYWFLYTLFCIFLVYPIIYKFSKNSVFKLSIIIVGLLGMYMLLPEIHIFKFSTMNYYLIFFTVGAMLKIVFADRLFVASYNKKRITIIGVLLFALWIFFVKFDVAVIEIIAAFVGILTLYLFVQYKPVEYMFKRFGKYSLQLYLFNGYLLVISRTIAVSVLGLTNPFMIISFNILIDFFLSYIFIKYICERIKFVKVLVGM